jgi:hypothetical protein
MRKIAVLFEASPKQIVLEALFRKYTTEKWAGGAAQVMEHLPTNMRL